jgi:hypothetical protein
MEPIHVEAIVQTDGELHLSNLPFHKGDHVEAIITLHAIPDEERRETAKKEFLERARNSKFKSTGPYPTRDEFHERH